MNDNDVHLSLDLETLDVDPSNNAAVVAVGATFFTLTDILATNFWALDPKYTPGTRSHSTYDWWRGTPFEIRQKMLSGDWLPWDFCADFSAHVGLHNARWVWGWPVRFDLGHLRSLFRAVERPFPFSFRNERDIYTLRDLAVRRGGSGVEIVFKQIHDANEAQHDAGADSLAQARMIQYGLQVIGKPRDTPETTVRLA